MTMPKTNQPKSTSQTQGGVPSGVFKLPTKTLYKKWPVLCRAPGARQTPAARRPAAALGLDVGLGGAGTSLIASISSLDRTNDGKISKLSRHDQSYHLTSFRAQPTTSISLPRTHNTRQHRDAITSNRRVSRLSNERRR